MVIKRCSFSPSRLEASSTLTRLAEVEIEGIDHIIFHGQEGYRLVMRDSEGLIEVDEVTYESEADLLYVLLVYSGAVVTDFSPMHETN